MDSSEGYYSSNVWYTDQKLGNLSNERLRNPKASHLAKEYGLCDIPRVIIILNKVPHRE